MRLRTDSGHIAGFKRVHELVGCDCDPEMAAGRQNAAGISHVAHDPAYADIPAAQLGDAWRITSTSGELTGYALTCPNESCDQGVHFWTHAYDCSPETREHSSCWTWTGAPEDGTLSAQPSLWVVQDRGGCGWHGFLTDGEMRSV